MNKIKSMDKDINLLSGKDLNKGLSEQPTAEEKKIIGSVFTYSSALDEDIDLNGYMDTSIDIPHVLSETNNSEVKNEQEDIVSAESNEVIEEMTPEEYNCIKKYLYRLRRDDIDSTTSMDISGKRDIHEVMKMCEKRKGVLIFKSNIYKWINIGISMIIILVSGIIIYRGLVSDCEDIFTVVASITIIVLKAIYHAFQIDNKGSNLLEIAFRYARIRRNCRAAIYNLAPGIEMVQFANELWTTIEDLEMQSFKTTYGPESIEEPSPNLQIKS